MKITAVFFFLSAYYIASMDQAVAWPAAGVHTSSYPSGYLGESWRKTLEHKSQQQGKKEELRMNAEISRGQQIDINTDPETLHKCVHQICGKGEFTIALTNIIELMR